MTLHRYWLSTVLSTLFLGACATVTPEPMTPAPRLPVTQAVPSVTVASTEPLRVIAVGDIMLDGTARPVFAQNGYDYAFAAVKHLFNGAAAVFGNLEGPLTDRGTAEQDKTYVFRSPPAPVSQALHAAGFTVLSLANNHTLDFGAEGLAQTQSALEAVGIGYTGAGKDLAEARRPVIVSASGKKLAFLAYSVTLPEHFYAGPGKPGTAFAHEAHVRADVRAARQQADIVLVSFHWGQEGKTVLRDYQVQLGHAAIDAGAAAVLGHHPHILQGIERYHDGVILYSLGNFTFGSYSKQAQVSAVAELTFNGNRVAALRMHPINVNNFEVEFQPKPLTGMAAKRVVDELISLSAQRQTVVASETDTAVLQLPAAVSSR
jgi:poly-gamma-glutamate capsule biosynthesis protein CapA/YwtB (metallophosphatase superfamily)